MPTKFNVLKHELVPHHEVLPNDQAKEVLKRYDCTPEQLPRILLTDPASVAVRAKPGQILKIKRDSPTAGESVTYRYVVEG